MNWKTPLTLVVLLVILLGGAYYGWQTVLTPAADDRTAAEETTPTTGCLDKAVYPAGAVVMAKSLRVNVWNAGSRSGLAGDTLAELTDKGFREGRAGNGAGGLQVTNVTVTTNAEGGDPKAELVAQQFKGHVDIVVQSPGNGPRGINVYVGDAFKRVDRSAPVRLRLPDRVQLCVVG